MLDGRRQMQIFQTVMGRLTLNMPGPPDSYNDEEKEFYLAAEQEILETRKKGTIVNYDFPNDYD